MKTSSHRLIATRQTLSHLLNGVKTEVFAKEPTYELSIEELPALDAIFPRLGHEVEEDSFIPYPPIEIRPDLSEVCLYLHSSGSTGLPKVIPQTHKVQINLASSRTFFKVLHRQYYSSNDTLAFALDFRNLALRIAAMHLPPFHTLGIMIHIFQALRSCITIALYPPVTKRPDLLPIMPTPKNVLDHLQRTKSNAIITIPSNLQVWSHDPKSLDILKGLKFVVRTIFIRFGLHFFTAFLFVDIFWRSDSFKNWRPTIFCWSKDRDPLRIDRGRMFHSSFQEDRRRRSFLELRGVQ